MTITELRELARRYDDLAATRSDDRAHCQEMGAVLSDLDAALEAAGNDAAVRALAIGFLAGAGPGGIPRAAIALSYLTSPLTLRVSEVERFYVRISALSGEPHDRSHLPAWLTSAPFQPRYPGSDAETRALGGIGAGFSAYIGEIMTGDRRNYASLADMLVAARAIMTASGDDTSALVVIGHFVGARYGYAPGDAATLLGLFLDRDAGTATIRPLYRVLAALVCHEADDGDLPDWRD